MATATKSEPAISELTPELKAFIDGAVVPALVKEWIAERCRQNSLAPATPDVDNPSRAEEGATL